ncbi:MAG: hypothetical protein LBL66_09970 [Clostridiales bacterium]|nr:hypothetical protein [Clostridiales bacterium]
MKLEYLLDGNLEIEGYPDPEPAQVQLSGSVAIEHLDGGTEDLEYYLEGDLDWIAGDAPDRFRTVNPNGYFIYAFDFGAELKSAAMKMLVSNLNQTIEVSFDGIEYETIHETTTGAYNWFPGNADNTQMYDLSAADGFNANTGLLYLRFSGAPDSSGFDIAVYNIFIDYSLAGLSTYPAVTGAA